MTKVQILRELDQTGLLIGELLQRALLANDRSKYLLTLLQMAFEQARSPRPAPDTLEEERRLVGLDEPRLDTVVPGARADGQGNVDVPEAPRVLEFLDRSLKEMLEPIVAAKAPEGARMQARFAEFERYLTEIDGKGYSEEWLDKLTSGVRGRGDSLHLLIMDAHRTLNRIQRDLTETRVDGVPAIGIEQDDIPLVRAFAEGVRRTAHLKLDHPGLDTTASRYGGQLVLQNDIGVTDSHVLVITVSRDHIEVTYTDIHDRRVDFFKHLLGELEPRWKEISTRSSEELEEGERYSLLRGTIPAGSHEAKEAALRTIGSRLVFLIDWNKARKRLKTFIGNKGAVRVLERAAAEEFGQMAFLQLGGDELIYEALEMAARGHLRCGEPFQGSVGSQIAQDCMAEVLRICQDGTARGETVQMVRDRLVAVISHAFERKTPGEAGQFRRHAGLIVEASLTFHSMLQSLKLGKASRSSLERSQRRIDRWESEGDEIVNRLRRNEGRRPGSFPVRELSGALDDSLDHIDRAAFFLSRIDTPSADRRILGRLGELGALMVRAAQEFYKSLAAYTSRMSQGSADDLKDFLEGVGRLDAIAKLKDSAEREFMDSIFELAAQGGQKDRLREIGKQLSDAVDGLALAAFALYDSRFRFDRAGG